LVPAQGTTNWLGKFPFTGFPASSLALVGLILVAFGTALTVTVRRWKAAGPDERPKAID
jgi:hypothetical protein